MGAGQHLKIPTYFWFDKKCKTLIYLYFFLIAFQGTLWWKFILNDGSFLKKFSTIYLLYSVTYIQFKNSILYFQPCIIALFEPKKNISNFKLFYLFCLKWLKIRQDSSFSLNFITLLIQNFFWNINIFYTMKF